MPLTMVHDWRDHHLHELDEAVAERLKGGTEFGPVVPHGDAQRQTDQDLDIQKLDQPGGFMACLLDRGEMRGCADLRRLAPKGRLQLSVAITRSTITPDWPR
jgi:hypothetical protein